MHTETNLREGPVQWLWKQWANVLRVRNSGIATVGFTWYSLTDQVDWDAALRENNGNVNAVGLYDLNRDIRAVGRAYKELIAQWQHVLPAQSLCLTVPITLPDEYNTPAPERRRDWMRQFMQRKSGSLTRARLAATSAPLAGGVCSRDASLYSHGSWRNRSKQRYRTVSRTLRDLHFMNSEASGGNPLIDAGGTALALANSVFAPAYFGALQAYVRLLSVQH